MVGDCVPRLPGPHAPVGDRPAAHREAGGQPAVGHVLDWRAPLAGASGDSPAAYPAEALLMSPSEVHLFVEMRPLYLNLCKVAPLEARMA